MNARASDPQQTVSPLYPVKLVYAGNPQWLGILNDRCLFLYCAAAPCIFRVIHPVLLTSVYVTRLRTEISPRRPGYLEIFQNINLIMMIIKCASRGILPVHLIPRASCFSATFFHQWRAYYYIVLHGIILFYCIETSCVIISRIAWSTVQWSFKLWNSLVNQLRVDCRQ